MKRIRTEKAVGQRGFSKWINPKMRGYLLACCDCGLVHEMEFKVFRKATIYSDGSYEMQPLVTAHHGVSFRARRAAGHTAKLRAKEAHK